MDWKPPSRKRALTADEADLWAYTMRDAKALKRRERGRKTAVPDDASSPTMSAGTSGVSGPIPDKSGRKSKPSPTPAAAPPAEPWQPPQPKTSMAAYDANERRRLGKNPELIDARLDLHGMRQREAHTALRSFLFSCSVRGFRHVLVITGKGTAAERQRDFLCGDERGVLRRLVPQWLADPELRVLVVSYAVSHIRHGGEGALYVRLRKAGSR